MNTRKKRIFIAILFAITVLGGFSYWIYQKLETLKENKELSNHIPTYINNFFNGKSADDYPLKNQKIEWNGKYFILDEYSDLIYNKKRNEKMNTHQYFPKTKVNGLVLVKEDRKILGYYKKKDSDVENTSNEAFQEYYVISFFDIKKEIVMAKDTIWGALPKEWKSSTENQHGILPFAGKPDENELIEIIQNRLK